MFGRLASLRVSPLALTTTRPFANARTFATIQPAILNRNMGANQWYLHFSREQGADLAKISAAIKSFRQACEQRKVNVVLGFGPTLLPELTKDLPKDFQPYPGYAAPDGSTAAKATQEEFLVWINHGSQGDLWKVQFDLRASLAGQMRLARETPTFIYGNSQDMTGFIDGTGNPEPERDAEVGCVPAGEPGAGGSHIIAQRWIHNLKAFNALPLKEQEGVFGRTKKDSTRLAVQPAHSHLAHVELRQGKSGDESTPKRDEITRRSTPYAFPAPPTGGDGVNGLYFIGFCRSQAPLRERMRAMYGMDGQVRDRLTDFSTPASGYYYYAEHEHGAERSFYFAPSVEVLNAAFK